MSFLFTLDESNFEAELPAIFDRIEKSIKGAEPLFEIEGQRLEVLARNLPKHQAHFDQLAQEMKQLIKWLENFKAKKEAIHLKNYSRGQRALSATDQRIFLGGEQDIIELNQFIIEATLFYGQLDAIVEGFKTMNWMLSNITKLRVAELQDVII